MANPSDYKRFSVYSRLDKSSGDYDIPGYERDIKNIINNAVKSALPEGAFFHVDEKQLSQSGRGRWDIYVHADDKKLMDMSLGKIEEQLTYRGGGNKYSITRPRPVTDEQAISLASEEKARELLKDWHGGKKTEENETTRFNKGALLKIVGVLTVIADITRRILSSVLTFSQQSLRDTITAHNLGMSYEAVRGYRHMERAHGMKEGTITGAVSDIQTKFGNITALDEKSLEALAVVMGGEIKEAIDMGLGASNPEKILGMILDTFNEKANAGYNSVGQYVGEQQARRELYSYLLKVSPQIADIFATMQEEQHNINSIYRNQYETFEQMKNAVPNKVGNNSDARYGVTVTLGQEFNEVKDLVSKIYENFIVGIAPALLPLLRRIADSRVGMTEEQKRQRNEENKAEHNRAIASTEKTMQAYKDNWNSLNDSEKAYYRALEEYVAELKQENSKRTIYNKIKTPSELRLRGEEIATEKYSNTKSDYDNINWTGGSLPEIYATSEEVNAVVGAYNFDTPEERQKFAEYVAKELPSKNAKITKYVEKQKEKARKAEYSEAKKNATSWYNSNMKSDEIQSVRKRIPSSYRRYFDTLMLAYKTFNLDYDLQSSDWINAEATLFKELKRLADAGYIARGNKTGTYQGIIDKNYQLSSANAEFIEGVNPLLTSDEDAYMAWLYSKYKGEIDPHILSEREEKALEEYNKAMAIESLQLLYDTEGAKVNDWTKNIPRTYTSGGTVRGTNEYNNSGEVTHKIVLEYTDKKGNVHTQQLFSVLGKEGYEGVLGTLTRIDEDKGASYVVSQGTPASEGM